MIKKIVASIFISFIAFQVLAHQETKVSGVNRYFVYFKDKSGDNYPYELANPSEFLTQRAIDRRKRQNIAIEHTDLPVSPDYVQKIEDEGVDVFFTSRWLNGALVNSKPEFLKAVSDLAFVDSIALIADNTVLSTEKNVPPAPTEFDVPPSVSASSDIQLKMLGADQMHTKNVKGQDMIIAVLDDGFTGVNKYTPFEHLWNDNRIIATRDFVSNSGNVFQKGSHGTSVFSTIAAKYQSDEGNMYGVAHEAKYILCITEEGGSEDTIEEYNWLLGAEYADSLGADIINGSLGYRLFDISQHSHDYADMDGVTTVVSRAAKIAASKGMVVVVSAGNEGDKSWKYITPPADADNILTVGSVNPDFSRSSFSSVGNTSDGRIKPDIAAFGGATAIMRGNGTITRGSGTSFASPLIAGFAAGIWQSNPEWTSQQVMEAIKKSGHQAHAPDSLLGHGVPNFSYAVAGKALSVSDILKEEIKVYPNPFTGNNLYLITKGKFSGGIKVRIIDPKGSLIYNRQFKKKEIKERMELEIDGSQQGVYFLFLQTKKDQKVVKLINF